MRTDKCMHASVGICEKHRASKKDRETEGFKNSKPLDHTQKSTHLSTHKAHC